MPSFTVSYDNIATMTIANRQTRLTSLPYQNGNLLVGAFLDRLEPIKTKNWFMESPKECIISANIATFPVRKNAPPFNKPITKLTIAAVSDDMLPFLNREKISFITDTSYLKSYYPFK